MWIEWKMFIRLQDNMDLQPVFMKKCGVTNFKVKIDATFNICAQLRKNFANIAGTYWYVLSLVCQMVWMIKYSYWSDEPPIDPDMQINVCHMFKKRPAIMILKSILTKCLRIKLKWLKIAFHFFDQIIIQLRRYFVIHENHETDNHQFNIQFKIRKKNDRNWSIMHSDTTKRLEFTFASDGGGGNSNSTW